jgi:hypothetical protein
LTLLTPTFAERQHNGAAGPHIIAAHEPTREGEIPPLAGTGILGQPAPLVATGVPLKIALIGTAPSSRMLAPYNDPSWKIWGCSPGNMNSLPRVDIWFELHSNLLWPEHASYGVPYIEWLKQQKFPIYMQDQSLVPNAIAFPMTEMVAEFGRDFFTSSFAWMMALAIKMGAAEIALYGIDMASRDEYILQRPGFYFFRHMAQQRGIRVSAPHESDIMQSPALYAYVDSTPLGRKLAARAAEVKGRVGSADQQISQATQTKTYLQGALEDIDYMQSIWSGAMDEVVLEKVKAVTLQARVSELETEIVRLRGLFATQPVLTMAADTLRPATPSRNDEPAQPPPAAIITVIEKRGRRARKASG